MEAISEGLKKMYFEKEQRRDIIIGTFWSFKVSYYGRRQRGGI